MANAFLTITGQYENIGDAMHRRVLVQWIRKRADLHLYVGGAPDSFLRAVTVGPSDKVYRSLPQWLAKCASLSSGDAFVFSSGQMRLRPKRFLGEIALLPLITKMRSQGVTILRLGVEALPHTLLPPYIFNRLIRQTECLWRDEKSRKIFSHGTVAPDLAFAEFNDSGRGGDILAVSMRGDKEYPSSKWFDVVNHIAEVHKLRPVTLTQVRRDSDRNGEIASELECEHVTWPNSIPHTVQEKQINAVYREASIVLSDRLHVLIAGVNHHAVPISPQSEYNAKINKHFSTIGLEEIAFNLRDTPVSEAKSRAEDLPHNRREDLDHARKAKQKLIQLQKETYLFDNNK